MRSVLLRGLVVGCTFVLVSCSSPASPSGPLDRQVVIAAGQTMSLSDAAVSLRFDSVQGDSRCPIDASCIQGGDAIVRLDVDGLGRRATHDLHTGDSRVVTRHETLTITLLELSPYPYSARPTQPGDYRATLRVTR